MMISVLAEAAKMNVIIEPASVSRVQAQITTEIGTPQPGVILSEVSDPEGEQSAATNETPKATAT